VRLFCFGLGYSANRFVALHAARFSAITGTMRDADKAEALTRDGIGGHAIAAQAFDGTEATTAVGDALADADVLLVSVPPGPAGDPTLAHYADRIAAAPHLSAIVYFSTIGVYGDHAGAWVDETAPAAPGSTRARARVAAERLWEKLRTVARRPAPARHLWSRTQRLVRGRGGTRQARHEARPRLQSHPC
jgi:hypothetical protein